MSSGGPFSAIESTINFLRFSGMNEYEIGVELRRRVVKGNVFFFDTSLQGTGSGPKRRLATIEEMSRLAERINERFPIEK